MSKSGNFLRGAGTAVVGVTIFALTACYVFVALLLLSLGIVTFPSVMLGKLGFLTVTTDLAEPVMLIGSAGVLLVGLGMSFCMFPVCVKAYMTVSGMIRKAEIRRKRILNEENKTA